jgi:hypothetical protein
MLKNRLTQGRDHGPIEPGNRIVPGHRIPSLALAEGQAPAVNLDGFIIVLFDGVALARPAMRAEGSAGKADRGSKNGPR